jgi:hypothetical protein
MRNVLLGLAAATLACLAGCGHTATPASAVDSGLPAADVADVDVKPAGTPHLARNADGGYRMTAIASFEGIEEPLMRWNAAAGTAEPKEEGGTGSARK